MRPILHVWQGVVWFWGRWYGKVSGAVPAVAALVTWWWSVREKRAKAKKAEIELSETQKRARRDALKSKIADFVRTHSGAFAGDVAQQFQVEIGEAVALMMELENEKTIWHTNRATWMFGPKPPFLS